MWVSGLHPEPHSSLEHSRGPYKPWGVICRCWFCPWTRSWCHGSRRHCRPVTCPPGKQTVSSPMAAPPVGESGSAPLVAGAPHGCGIRWRLPRSRHRAALLIQHTRDLAQPQSQDKWWCACLRTCELGGDALEGQLSEFVNEGAELSDVHKLMLPIIELVHRDQRVRQHALHQDTMPTRGRKKKIDKKTMTNQR